MSHRAMVAYNEAGKEVYGSVSGIENLVKYEGKTKREEEDFHNAVEDYVDLCREVK